MFKLKLQNFRGFLDNEFTFSRVNILIGENSAGKSSLLKFLLALKQSLRVPNSRDYNLTFSGEDVDLGNYEEIIYNHEVDRNLSFSFEFGKEYVDFLNENVPTLTKITGEINTPTTISFEISQDLSNHGNVRTMIKNETIGKLEIIPNPNNNAENNFIMNKPSCDIYFEFTSYPIPLDFEEIEYTKTGFLTGIDLNKIWDTLQKMAVPMSRIAFLSTAPIYVEYLLETIGYSNNPDFEAAKRIYFKRDKKVNSSISNIEELIYLLSGEGSLQGQGLTNFTQEYIAKLNLFGIVDTIYLKKNDSTRELRVVINGIDSNITDVGFGVSLQLPIIAEAILAEKTEFRHRNNNKVIKKGKMLLIEQPEIHLHPSLQAKFIESLLELGENNMYFVETHSEHIVRKLQVLVKEGKYGLKPEDVCIHYFRKENGHIATTLHTIDGETGKLSPKFPTGFYDVSTNLAYELIN